MIHQEPATKFHDKRLILRADAERLSELGA
jgi:hypothetical protein